MTADYKIEHWTYVTTKKNGSREDAVEIFVNDRAATREAIIYNLRKEGVAVKTRSDWHAKVDLAIYGGDWDYNAIALHHAGNSFSCDIDGLDLVRKAEEIDFGKFDQLSYHYAIDCSGTVYEALDIREKGSHIARGNAGVVGIVFLADFSVRGEAKKFTPGAFNLLKKYRFKDAAVELASVAKDNFDFAHDEPTSLQINSVYKLVNKLKEFFNIRVLGGHREFARMHGSDRPCPGAYGMILADIMRRDFGLSAP